MATRDEPTVQQGSRGRPFSLAARWGEAPFVATMVSLNNREDFDPLRLQRRSRRLSVSLRRKGTPFRTPGNVCNASQHD